MATPVAERSVLAATYLVLAAVAVMLAVIETFLVPQRIFGGIEGLAAVIAVVGNVVVGSLGGIGTRTWAGVTVPVASWFLAIVFLVYYQPGGDVLVPGKLPADPGIVVVGIAYLILGLLAGGIAIVLTAVYTYRAKAPTTPR